MLLIYGIQLKALEVFLLFLVDSCTGFTLEAEDTWTKYEVIYDRSFSLICDDRQLNLTTHKTDYVRLYWILPSGRQVEGVMEEERFFTSGTSPDGWNLTLTAVDEPDFGEYVCVLVTSNNTIYSIKLGVNVDGAYFGDLFLRYRQQAMIGGIAGGSTLVLITLVCLVNHYRYKNQDNDGTPDKVNFKRKSSYSDAYEYENPTALYDEEMKEVKPKHKNINSNKIYKETTLTESNSAHEY